jgi:hypothetical protein
MNVTLSQILNFLLRLLMSPAVDRSADMMAAAAAGGL